jgi:hypothetical protein
MIELACFDGRIEHLIERLASIPDAEPLADLSLPRFGVPVRTLGGGRRRWSASVPGGRLPVKPWKRFTQPLLQLSRMGKIGAEHAAAIADTVEAIPAADRAEHASAETPLVPPPERRRDQCAGVLRVTA